MKILKDLFLFGWMDALTKIDSLRSVDIMWRDESQSSAQTEMLAFSDPTVCGPPLMPCILILVHIYFVGLVSAAADNAHKQQYHMIMAKKKKTSGMGIKLVFTAGHSDKVTQGSDLKQ